MIANLKKYICIFIGLLLVIGACSLFTISNNSSNSNNGNNNDNSCVYTPTNMTLTNYSVLNENVKYSGYGCQSLAIYNDILYTFYTTTTNNGLVEIRDLATNNVLNTMEISVGHANGVFVSNIWHSETDDTPLIFVSHCTSDNLVTAIYFVDNVANVYRTYAFDSTYSGFQASFVIDNENGIGYTIGTAQGYTGYSENANTTIAVFDLTQETQLDNGYYTFAMTDYFEIDELPFKQDVEFHDGKIWLLTCKTSNNWTKAIYGINPTTRRIETIIDDFLVRQVKYSEGEGIDFYNGYLYVNTNNGNLVRYSYL